MAELVAGLVGGAHLPSHKLMPKHRKPRLLRQGPAANHGATFRTPEPALTAQVNTKPRGRQFFNNPGPTNIPDRILRAMDRPVMDFLVARVPRDPPRLLCRHEAHPQDRPGTLLPRLDRPRRLGSGGRQPVLARRPRAGDRDRLLLAGLQGARRDARPQGRDRRRRLAQGRRHLASSPSASPPTRPRDQGRARRPQRDRDRHGAAARRGPPRDGPGQASGAAALRHDLLARQHGIQDGCLGHRRHHRRQPEGPDDADRHGDHRRQQQGARSLAQVQAAASTTSTGS